jgi:hypothetical protein
MDRRIVSAAALLALAGCVPDLNVVYGTGSGSTGGAIGEATSRPGPRWIRGLPSW